MIEAEQLTKRFGSFTAIADVSFRVASGEIVGFLGPNGAGKSTTMRILCGVFPPSSGRAAVGGHDVVTASLQARRVVGYFPERVSLYLDMTVREFLRYVAEMKGLPSGGRTADVDAAMERAATAHVAHRLIGTLSKGYRQRVGLAQALLGHPRVLVLDEPTAGLDPEQVAEMRHLIRSLRGDSTVVLSSHILSEVEATCDRVMIIHRGHILAVDTPANLNQRLRQTSQVHLEVRAPVEALTAALQEIPGVLHVECTPAAFSDAVTATVSTEKDRDLRATLAARIAAAGWALHELRPVTLSLETIFLSLVARRDGAVPGDSPHEVSRHLSA